MSPRAGRTPALCPRSVAGGEIAALRFALRRLVLRYGSPRSLDAAEAAATSHGVLDGWLLDPLTGLIGDRTWSWSPTGALHALPWSTLPSCHARPVTVVPSATAVAAGHAGPAADAGGRFVLVAAARPAHASDEVEAIGRGCAGRADAAGRAGRRRHSPRSTGRRGHIAAHGEFRADNPLFSHLALADGPLTVYDLTGLRHRHRVVLSACDSGLSAVHPGDELMGLAPACSAWAGGPWSPASARSTTRPPGSSWSTSTGGWRTGVTPAAALAAAQAAIFAAGEPAARASAGSFLCFGAG